MEDKMFREKSGGVKRNNKKVESSLKLAQTQQRFEVSP